MTTMAPMSSTMAKANRNSFSEGCTREPMRARTPNAMAMSVAMGMPQPRTPVPPRFTATNIRAGTTMPPSAAMAGSAARRGSFSSPTETSRLISKPTTKKNNVIRPSLTQWRKSNTSERPATRRLISELHSDS